MHERLKKMTHTTIKPNFLELASTHNKLLDRRNRFLPQREASMRKVLKMIFQYFSLNSSAKSEICCSAVDRGVLVWCIELFFCIFCLN